MKKIYIQYVLYILQTFMLYAIHRFDSTNIIYISNKMFHSQCLFSKEMI